MSKVLNLLYDEWDLINDVPYENGINYFSLNRLGNIHDYFTTHLIGTYNRNEKFKVKKCKLSDINNHENFYYFIVHSGVNFVDLISKGLPLSKLLLENIKSKKNINVILINPHESDSEYSFELLVNELKKENLPENQFFVINNNSYIETYPDKFNSKINTKKLNLLPMSAAGGLINLGGYQFKEEKNGKFFMCFNRGYKNHRVALILELKKNGILDETNWTLLYKETKNIYEMISGIFHAQKIETFKNEIDFLNKLKFKFSDFEETLFENINDFNSKYTGTKNILLNVTEFVENYTESYVNIVTETEFFSEKNVVQITEKSLKPFFYYQFPIFLTTHNHIKKLKEFYNFDFFDDIINHDYDNVIDDKIRFEKVVNELKRINNNKNNFINFYKNNRNRFEENKRKIKNIIENHQDYFYFENLI